MLRMLGADAVGMSTVPEVIVGCQAGFRIMVLSAVTNVNLPDAMEPVLIENVIACAHVTESKLGELMEATIQRAFCQ
jgi:purine-nucleoside phosphorylase